MDIKLYDFGLVQPPERAYIGDAGADVYINKDYIIQRNSVKKIPLGFGIKLPSGYVGFIMPRSGLSSKGITCELSPVDSGYRGEVHAIVNNHNTKKIILKKGTRIGQLVIFPFLQANFISETKITDSASKKKRGTKGFGSSGIVGSIEKNNGREKSKSSIE